MTLIFGMFVDLDRSYIGIVGQGRRSKVKVRKCEFQAFAWTEFPCEIIMAYDVTSCDATVWRHDIVQWICVCFSIHNIKRTLGQKDCTICEAREVHER